MPSLSTTSSLHLIRREDDVASLVSVGASSARNLRVGMWVVESWEDSVVVRNEFEPIGWRVRDIVMGDRGEFKNQFKNHKISLKATDYKVLSFLMMQPIRIHRPPI